MYSEYLDKSGRKPYKIWVDNCSEFYNGSVKSSLEDNDIEIYSTYNQEKPAAAERFFRTLKNEIYKHMTAVLKYGWVDKLDDKVNKYSNIYLKNMKPADIKYSAYIDSDVQNNDRKVGD